MATCDDDKWLEAVVEDVKCRMRNPVEFQKSQDVIYTCVTTG